MSNKLISIAKYDFQNILTEGGTLKTDKGSGSISGIALNSCFSLYYRFFEN